WVTPGWLAGIDSKNREGMRMKRPLPAAVLLTILTAVAVAATVGGRGSAVARSALPTPRPTVSDYVQLTSPETPATETQCFTANSDSGGRRCFTPQSIRAAYNVGPLYSSGLDGTGQTIAIIDSYGSDTIAHDLHVFDHALGVQSMCGEENV